MTTRPLISAAVAALFVAACGKQQGMPEMPPPEVGVVVVHAQPVPLIREASARLAPTRASDVRARVPGVLQKRLYKEGSMVKEGELLVQIDPAPYRAQDPDRKSTRLNSSHLGISYAVFCLKKKKKT